MCICVLFELESLWFSGFSFIPTGPSQILSLNSTSTGNEQIYHTLLQSKISTKKKTHFPFFLTFPFTLMLAHMHRHTHTYQKATLLKLPIISAALNCRCVCVCVRHIIWMCLNQVNYQSVSGTDPLSHCCARTANTCTHQRKDKQSHTQRRTRWHTQYSDS